MATNWCDTPNITNIFDRVALSTVKIPKAACNITRSKKIKRNLLNNWFPEIDLALYHQVQISKTSE